MMHRHNIHAFLHRNTVNVNTDQSGIISIGNDLPRMYLRLLTEIFEYIIIIAIIP
jgi:hypothetical protein